MRKIVRAIRQLLTARRRRIAEENFIMLHWDNGE